MPKKSSLTFIRPLQNYDLLVTHVIALEPIYLFFLVTRVVALEPIYLFLMSCCHAPL
jgi:hypothetical protein